MASLTTIRKGAPLVAAVIGVAGTSLLPIASADTLPNGYNVTCTMNGSQALCNISGCPRVKGDEAGDVVHTLFNGIGQVELSKGCNNTTTDVRDNIAGPFTLSVQGCRKHPVGSDDCGPWSDYKFTPPQAAQPAQPAQPAAPAAQPAQPAAPAATPPPPKDAIQVNENQADQVSFDVHNSSSIDAQCNYNAKETRGLDVPATVTQNKS